jgi:hypothetical protein
MGEVRWGWRKKDYHPPLTPPIKGGEYLVAEGLILIRPIAPSTIDGEVNYIKRRVQVANLNPL